MARAIRNFYKFVIPGVAVGSGLIILNNVLSSDKYVVNASRSPHGNPNSGSAPYGPIGRWDANWDRRNPTHLLDEKGIHEEDKHYNLELERLKPMATRNLFLIRHGQYNLKGNFDEEKYLTPLGRLQAEYTENPLPPNRNRLKELNFPYAVLHRSTMTRAQETAEIILECFKDNPIKEIRNCNLLEEGAPIPPEPPVKHWQPEVYQFFQDGPRIEAAFRKYFHRADVSQAEDSYEVIVCHSNVIRYFVCRALQFPPDAWLRFTIHHCSITWVVITPTGRVIVRCVGDCGHIPMNHMTTT